MYSTILKGFEENQNKERAEQMSAYMKNLFPFYGLSAQDRRSVYKDLLKDEKKKKIIDWDLLDKCWANEHREFQYFVVDYLAAMKNFLLYEDIFRLKKFIDTKQWWDTMDGLHSTVGDLAFLDKRVNSLMLEWSKDKDFWVRRIAINHQLKRKEKTDTDLLEKILVNNLGSKEFFINKAIGWSLREFSKTNPQWVKDFIQKYREKMNSLSIREGSKYI